MKRRNFIRDSSLASLAIASVTVASCNIPAAKKDETGKNQQRRSVRSADGEPANQKGRIGSLNTGFYNLIFIVSQKLIFFLIKTIMRNIC